LCFGMGMTLREGNREYFYEKLDKHFPGLRQRYEKKYGDSYGLTSDNNNELMAILAEVCAANNIICDIEKIFAFMGTLEEKDNLKQGELF